MFSIKDEDSENIQKNEVNHKNHRILLDFFYLIIEYLFLFSSNKR